MNSDYLLKTAQSANTFLARWKNTRVLVRGHRLWPRTLEVVLFRSVEEMGDKNLCLSFEPIWIHGYIEWDDVDLVVNVVDATSSPAAGRTSSENVLELVDARSGFRCVTESLEVKENVKLK